MSQNFQNKNQNIKKYNIQNINLKEIKEENEEKNEEEDEEKNKENNSYNNNIYNNINNDLNNINNEDMNKKEISNNEEFENLKDLDHPNIIKLYEYYDLPYHNCWGFVMELCLCNLKDYLYNEGPFDNEDIIAFIMSQILEGVYYCHLKDKFHGDLKLENILIYDKNGNYPLIKICDFGTGNLVKQEIRPHTPEYLAPELILIEKNQKNEFKILPASKEGDLWSCGVIMYLLIYGKYPINGDSNEEIYENIIKIKNDDNLRSSNLIDNRNNLSEECKEVLSKLLSLNPSDRKTAKDILFLDFFTKNKVIEKYNSLSKSIESEFITKIKNYKIDQALVEISFSYLIHYFQDIPKIKEANIFFRHYDEGQLKGYLTESDFKNIIKDLTDEEIHKIFAAIDIDGSKKVDYEELARIIIDREKIFLDHRFLRIAFNHFSENNICITENELKKKISNDSVVERILYETNKKLNKNDNYLIFYDDFLKLF